MAEQKKKKMRTRAQETRAYKFVYGLVYPLINLIMYPQRTLHRDRIPNGPCVVCPNHSSLADPPMACFAVQWSNPLRIMAKKELMQIPFVGWVFDKIGTFGVDRGNSDIGAIKHALRVLKDGEKLLMFPEGTRVSEGEGDAKTGAVMLALKAGVPVLPMYIPQKKKLFHRSTVVIGEPYYLKPAGRRATPAEYEQFADELLEKIYELEGESR